ncbi:hypothetical protein AAFF_G00092870 [Aldrovandia affinis]|uniref:Oxygen-regulated protein 1 n=1 Tax=Aldrovandia affinis TaxID=143900 RepID=A0AAD7WXI5_9TELE|nr:hypothetical protein AAFF_G00092870 [Aldrovandia affinis]
MSDTAPQKSQQDQSSGSGHTMASRHPPIASKRVCFYKSGDPQFSGLRLVINSRTFKTFDALLDSLSKKVPLPFGVRNITTPSGVHAVRSLEELQDGKSYICSDRKKVKPINLEVASKKLPPWHGARPFSGRRRAIQLARRNRAAKRGNSARMWTPKRLVVFKNGDPGIKHTIMLQKKTTQTFESLLDYMSETMRFPVVKLHTPDGRRIHNSIAGSLNDLPSNPTGSVEMDPNATLGSVEADTCTCVGDLGEAHHLMPPDDDIEKSFRVNQDGSMTVEMKVRLTIKQEETIHWSTTLKRSSVANQLEAACIPQSELDGHSPEFNVVPSEGVDGADVDGHEYKEENNIPNNENGYVCEEEKDESSHAEAEVQEQDSCIEQQASHEGEEVSQDDEQGSCVEEQGNNKERQESNEEEQDSCVDEQASYEVEEASSVDEQDTNTEHQFSHGEEQASNVECQTSYAKKTYSYEEGKSCYEEEQDCCERKSANGAEKKENNKNQFSHDEAQDSYVEGQRDFIDKQSTYEEEQGCCVAEQARSVEEQGDNTRCHCRQEEAHASHEGIKSSYEEVQNCSEKEQGSCLEEQENNEENQSDYEEEQESYVEDNGHYLDEQSSYREEHNSHVIKQTSYEEKESRYEEDQANYVEEQESLTEEHPTYEEKQSSCEDKQDSYGEEQATYDEEQESHVEEKLSICERQRLSYIAQQATYASNAEEKSSFEPYGQRTVPAESGVDGINKASPPSRTMEEFTRETSQMRTGSLSELHSVAEEAEKEEESEERIYNSVSQSVKTLEDLANSLRSAALNSSLAFSYDSKGSLKKESEGMRVKSIRDMFLARSNMDLQHGHKRLPSPHASELSDYRPEMSDSKGHRSQVSLNTSTESGEDDPGRQSIVKGYVRKTIERLYGRNDAAGKRPPSASKTKRKQSPSRNRVGTLTSFHEARSKVTTDLSYFNATSLYDTYNEPMQCIAMNAREDTREGVPIDKGNWLLKENHLIRKSLPEHSTMYGNADTTSVETGQENTSDDAPYSHFGSNNPLLAVVTSPDLKDPPVPKCTYFNLPHGSDSDPFQDDLTIKTKGSNKVDPAEKIKDPLVSLTPEKNGSLPSFAPIEFKLPDNKVHPQSEEPVVVNQPTRAQGGIARMPLRKAVYQVHVVTGDLWNAGTEANVYITVYGENGDTGSRQLLKSNKIKTFNKGQCEVVYGGDNTSSSSIQTIALIQRQSWGEPPLSSGEGWNVSVLMGNARTGMEVSLWVYETEGTTGPIHQCKNSSDTPFLPDQEDQFHGAYITRCVCTLC